MEFFVILILAIPLVVVILWLFHPVPAMGFTAFLLSAVSVPIYFSAKSAIHEILASILLTGGFTLAGLTVIANILLEWKNAKP